MSRYLVTLAYSNRLSGSRTYEVGVDLTRDFEHVALLVVTVSEDEIGGRGSRAHADRVRSVARYAAAIAAWAESQVAAGRLDSANRGDRRVAVPAPELDVIGVHDDPATLADGDELLTFER